MKKNYTHLNPDDRDRIAVMYNKGTSISDIARELERNKGTISSEIDRNSSLEYDCYLSWERGTNENTNALIRWYLPKGTDFSKLSDEQIMYLESTLNHRPRKYLGFKAPLEAVCSFVALTY